MTTPPTEPTPCDRYKIENFKKTTEKKVPFETLDYTIYKNTNFIVFATSEKRLTLWIEMLKRRYVLGLADNAKITTRLEESDNPEEKSKCERIVLALISKESLENIITITVTLSTGRIKIEGRFMKEWGKKEFDILTELVNSPDLTKTNDTIEINDFLDTIFQKNTEVRSSPTKENSLHIIKTNLSKLEADFVEFTQNTKKTIEGLEDKLRKKDHELELLRNELSESQVKNQQSFSDFTLKQLEMEAEIKKLQKRYQMLADNNTNPLCQISALRENPNQLVHQPDTSVEHCTTPQTAQKPGPSNEHTDTSKTMETSYNIPVENKFEKLAEKLDNSIETSIPDIPSNETTQTNPPPY